MLDASNLLHVHRVAEALKRAAYTDRAYKLCNEVVAAGLFIESKPARIARFIFPKFVSKAFVQHMAHHCVWGKDETSEDSIGGWNSEELTKAYEIVQG